MLQPEKLKKAFRKVEDENWAFRSFLKGQDEDEIDDLIYQMHRELFREMDCITCSNCCKLTKTAVNERDIAKISERLKMSTAEFAAAYLKKDEEEEEWVIPSLPCPFLTEKGCSIYDIRPETCREFPHTDKPEMISRLINLVNNGEICPVVFEILERLKDIYREEFEEFQDEMNNFWR